ncbi:hypothetical protein ACOME3_009656 [Neoechinorhynchus agilis]
MCRPSFDIILTVKRVSQVLGNNKETLDPSTLGANKCIVDQRSHSTLDHQIRSSATFDQNCCSDTLLQQRSQDQQWSTLNNEIYHAGTNQYGNAHIQNGTVNEEYMPCDVTPSFYDWTFSLCIGGDDLHLVSMYAYIRNSCSTGVCTRKPTDTVTHSHCLAQILPLYYNGECMERSRLNIWIKSPKPSAFFDAHVKANVLAYHIRTFINIGYRPTDSFLPRENYRLSAHYRSNLNYRSITATTRIYSFGEEMIEKQETVYGSPDSIGTFEYGFSQYPLCEFLVEFLKRLVDLQNFQTARTALDKLNAITVLTDATTDKVLLCILFSFDIYVTECDQPCQIYRIV